jgi:hypothetical protein
MFQHSLRNVRKALTVKRGAIFQILTAHALLLTAYAALAAPKLAPAKLDGAVTEDLASPYNIQAVVTGRAVALTWDWMPPDPGPAFQSFGYEVYRDTQVIAIVPKTAFGEINVPIGRHTYKVRAKGGSKDLGKKLAHYSAWSEPADVAIKLTCGGPPRIELTVEPTKKIYGAIPALRLHFTGQVTVPEGCGLDGAMYHIDSGMSTERAGPVPLDSKGRFDEFIDAMGAEDEPITGGATFNITVTAKNEMGITTSRVFTIDLAREDPYAPKNR